MTDDADRVSREATHGKRPVAILPWLYIGNKEHAKDAQTLRALGVRHILNCTPSREKDPNYGIANFFEQQSAAARGGVGAGPARPSAASSALPRVTYKRVPIYDNRGETVLPHCDGAVAFLECFRLAGSRPLT